MSDLDDFMREIAASSDGIRRTIMPTVWSGEEWSFAPKDGTTLNITLVEDPDQ